MPWLTLPEGKKTTLFKPARAAYEASEELVFPVEAQARTFCPKCFATETARVIPRSLKEPVGFSPSCFSQRCLDPDHFSNLSDRCKGVEPSLWVTIVESDSGIKPSLNRQTPLRSDAFLLVRRESSFSVRMGLLALFCAISSNPPQEQKYLILNKSNLRWHSRQLSFRSDIAHLCSFKAWLADMGLNGGSPQGF